MADSSKEVSAGFLRRPLRPSYLRIIEFDKKKCITSMVKWVTWQRPPVESVKINTDGGCLQNEKIGYSGVVMRDDSGVWMSGVVGKFDCFTNRPELEAELWGAFSGLALAWEAGCRSVQLEMDSKSALDYILERKVLTGSSAYWNRILNKVIQFKKKNGNYQLSLTTGKLMRGADKMAYEARIKAPYGFSLKVDMPKDVKTMATRDFNGEPRPRRLKRRA
ncbi:hypothetical protein Sjap_003015 [Stephania japonica]|uniref:RNase H type-1 domain-containing protein n=1 Tax=Stephania japonica TaxID=461633 RepID=A0AAP0KQK6_9MAGN